MNRWSWLSNQLIKMGIKIPLLLLFINCYYLVSNQDSAIFSSPPGLFPYPPPEKNQTGGPCCYVPYAQVQRLLVHT